MEAAAKRGQALGGVGTGFKQPNHAASRVCSHSPEPTEEERWEGCGEAIPARERAEGPKRKAWGAQLTSLQLRAHFTIRKWRQGADDGPRSQSLEVEPNRESEPSCCITHSAVRLQCEAALGLVRDWGVPSPPRAPGPSVPPPK